MKNIKKFSQFNESSIYSYGRQYRRFENVGGFNIDPKNQNVQPLNEGDYIKIESPQNTYKESWNLKIFVGCSNPQSMQTDDLYDCSTGCIAAQIFPKASYNEHHALTALKLHLYVSTYSDMRDIGQLKYAGLIYELACEYVAGIEIMPYTAFEITGRIPVPDFLSDKNKGLSQVESMLMKYEKKHVLAKMFFSQKSAHHKFKMLYELR